MDDEVWPPSFAQADETVSNGADQKPRINKAALLGHVAAALPIVAFLFLMMWSGICVYDNNENVTGPSWVVRLGGLSVAVLPILLCFVAGLAALIVGCMGRRAWTICEGIWGIGASFFLMFAYLVSEW